MNIIVSSALIFRSCAHFLLPNRLVRHQATRHPHLALRHPALARRHAPRRLSTSRAPIRAAGELLGAPRAGAGAVLCDFTSGKGEVEGGFEVSGGGLFVCVGTTQFVSCWNELKSELGLG